MLNFFVAVIAVPHLAVGEDHHLVHGYLSSTQIFDDFVAVGGIAHLAFTAIHLHHIAQDAACRHVDHLPAVAEDARDDMLATIL